MDKRTWWQTWGEQEARLTSPVTEKMLELAQLAAGMKVLDLASGAGEPALAAARRVMPGGLVFGVERDGEVLALAREKARALQLTNVHFEHADVVDLEVPPGIFDVATSRWGVIYMQEVERVLERVRRALRPGGTLVLASWAEPERVPFASLPRRVLSRYRELPPIDLSAPGVHRFADRSQLRSTLTRAGFTLAAVEELDVPVVEARSGAEIVAWYRALAGPSGLLSSLSEAQQHAFDSELAREAEQLSRDGRILLGGVTSIALARS